MKLGIISLIAGLLMTLLSGVLWFQRANPRTDWILYQSNFGAFYRMRDDGTDHQLIGLETGRNQVGQWSPDGHLVAFINGSPVDVGNSVYMMRSDGTALYDVTANDQYADTYVSLAWSPDSRLLAFGKFDGGGRYSIQFYDRATDKVFTVVPASRGFFRDLHSVLWWGPRGKSLFFTAGGNGGNGTTLYRVENIFDKSPKLITFDYQWLGDGTIYSPTFSPDGDWMAFYLQGLFEPDIYLIGAHDNSILNITADRPIEQVQSMIRWSSDSKSITFSATVNGNTDIFLVHTDGSWHRLTTSKFDEIAPSWAPNGEWISFVSMLDGKMEIYRMRDDGTGQQRLTTNSVPDNSPQYAPNQDLPTSAPLWLIVGVVLLTFGGATIRRTWKLYDS